MPDHLLTPSKITAWLDCPHYLTLHNQVDDGLLPRPSSAFGSFARLLVSKGEDHEKACLAHYRAKGKPVLEVPRCHAGESFADWVARSGNPFGESWDVVYQMPFIHDGIRGIADFVVRVEDPSSGAISYEPVDAKLARSDAKPGHVLPLCFYADAIDALTGIRPEHMHVWLGSGAPGSAFSGRATGTSGLTNAEYHRRTATWRRRSPHSSTGFGLRDGIGSCRSYRNRRCPPRRLARCDDAVLDLSGRSSRTAAPGGRTLQYPGKRRGRQSWMCQ